VAPRALSTFAYDLFALAALEPAEPRANASLPPRIPEVFHRIAVVAAEYGILRNFTNQFWSCAEQRQPSGFPEPSIS
jgi:hypothetical protein